WGVVGLRTRARGLRAAATWGRPRRVPWLPWAPPLRGGGAWGVMAALLLPAAILALVAPAPSSSSHGSATLMAPRPSRVAPASAPPTIPVTAPSANATPTPESVVFLDAPLYRERGHIATLHAHTAPDSDRSLEV